MKIEEIQERNYKATVKRGQINRETTDYGFLEKISEEVEELGNHHYIEGFIDEKELADIVLVCLSFAKHKNIDLLKVMEEKVIFNEKRTD